MEKLVWQMFILGTGNLENALTKGLGGVIFFTKDIQSETQFKNLISEIKSISLIKPFLAIDQEGGRVERTENIYPKRLSAKYAYENGTEFLQVQSKNLSKELCELGINLNFAPCIDVNTNPNNPIIGERAFANNPNDVIKGMEIFVQESRKQNVIPCVKHFPGHGDADKDSHLDLPQIDLCLDEMENIHIKPFKKAIENNIEMIMAAHLHCTCFDKNIIPASLSKNAIGYLRNRLNYNGVIISDDMFMKGVKDYSSLDAVIKGIEAGLDMFIFRESDSNTLEMIEKLVKIVEKDNSIKTKVLEANKRIEILKSKYL
ncbi:glycoside hydrolase family 3 protein [bacterium]|nr:glycoside hydrolase family 3 protein [bacterium]